MITIDVDKVKHGRVTVFLIEEDGSKTVDMIGEWTKPHQKKKILKAAQKWISDQPETKFEVLIESKP